MKLYGTPRSHFTRKVRLLMDHLGLDYQLIDVGNVADASAAQFAGNPVMSVPVLEEGAQWLIDSDHIARYIAARHDPEGRYGVETHDPARLNAHALLNAIMANEVKLVLACRTGLDPAGLAFFDKAVLAIAQALGFLDAHAGLFDGDRPGYLEFHFIAMWEHLALYKTTPLASYSALSTLGAALSGSDLIAASAFAPLA